MTDPYKVLGIPTTATDDEVKAAYRRLAKRYHPDANPGDKVAEQRMKEINAAYDQIMNKDGNSSSYGGSAGGGYYNPFGSYGYGGGYQGQSTQGGDPRMDAARNYLNYRRYQEALHVLAGIPDHDARWYYYSAVANMGVGNTTAALQQAKKAVELEPDEPEYREFLNELENPGRTYAGFGRGYASVPNMGVGRLCAGLLLFQLFCFYLRFCCR